MKGRKPYSWSDSDGSRQAFKHCLGEDGKTDNITTSQHRHVEDFQLHKLHQLHQLHRSRRCWVVEFVTKASRWCYYVNYVWFMYDSWIHEIHMIQFFHCIHLAEPLQGGMPGCLCLADSLIDKMCKFFTLGEQGPCRVMHRSMFNACPFRLSNLSLAVATVAVGVDDIV